MSAFYLTIECDNCSEDIFYGPCITTETRRNVPVIPLMMVEQVNFKCQNCDASNYTGDMEILCEGGEDLDEDDDTEDDADDESVEEVAR